MSKRTERHDLGEDCSKLCCPLPFFLQDLCLLVVIRYLDKYPLELLASMPLWLRNRLLKNLPILDLCRLESTPVARKVDVGAIWNSRVQRLEKPAGSLQVRRTLFLGPSNREKQSESSFQLNIGKLESKGLGVLLARHGQYNPADNVSKEIKAAFLQLKEHTQPGKIDLFIKTASDILDNSSRLDKSCVESVSLKLTSIQGHLVLSNIHTGSMCNAGAVTESASKVVWKRQATGLTVMDLSELHSSSQFRRQYPEQANTILLTPDRLIPTFLRSQDELTLLSLLTRDCNLQPSSASIHVDSITRSILIELSEERFVLDSGITLSSKQTIHTSIMSHLLRKVSILRLQCDKYTNIGVMVSMIHAAVADGKDSQLKHLFCTIPDLYMDVVQPFTTLFSLENFHQLSPVSYTHLTLPTNREV